MCIIPKVITEVPIFYCSEESKIPSIPRYFNSEITAWQEFYSTRNELLSALRAFGTVGPMGEALINSNKDGPPDPWPVECGFPQFLVVDDQMNHHNKHHYIEIEELSLISIGSLQSIWDFIAKNEKWSVEIVFPDSILLFLNVNGIWFFGESFSKCLNVMNIVDACVRR